MSEPLQGPGSEPATSGDGDVAAPGRDARPSAPLPATGDTPATGDDAVDDALRRLADVEDHDLAAQVTTFEDVHRALQDRLADAEG